MEKKYIKVSSASNDDGNDLFNAICADVIKMPPKEVKEMLSIPVSQDATMKDCITLIQENKIECEIIVKYSPPEPDPDKLFS